jgi:hypothetical protein
MRKKQSPPAPKSPSQSEQQQRLERQLERYSCTLDKSLSERANIFTQWTLPSHSGKLTGHRSPVP